MKQRDPELSKGWEQIVHTLPQLRLPEVKIYRDLLRTWMHLIRAAKLPGRHEKIWKEKVEKRFLQGKIT